MPVKVKGALPAKAVIEKENIFIMDESRAISQDIRPLKIAVLNLMPLKHDTEIQLLRALSNTPLQVDVTSYISLLDGADILPAATPADGSRITL